MSRVFLLIIIAAFLNFACGGSGGSKMDSARIRLGDVGDAPQAITDEDDLFGDQDELADEEIPEEWDEEENAETDETQFRTVYFSGGVAAVAAVATSDDLQIAGLAGVAFVENTNKVDDYEGWTVNVSGQHAEANGVTIQTGVISVTEEID